MKPKTPDPPSDEKKESSFKPHEVFQSEEKPTKIPEDYEWFDDQRGEPKGFRQVMRGLPIKIPQKRKDDAGSKDATKSFVMLGELYFQKQDADRLRKEMEDAIGTKKVLGLKKSQIAKGTGTSPFADAEVRRQISVGRHAVSAGKTKTDLAKSARPDTERLVDRMMIYELVDTYRQKKFDEEQGTGDLFIKITELGVQAYEKITSQANENDPLQYYYDVISGL